MPSGIGYGAMQGLDQILAQRFLEQQTKAQAAQQAAENAMRQQQLDIQAKNLQNDQDWRQTDVGLRTAAMAQQAALANQPEKPPPPRTFTINGRIVRENPDGTFQEVYSAPAAPGQAERPMLVSPGQAVFDPTTGKTVFRMPDRPTGGSGGGSAAGGGTPAAGAPQSYAGERASRTIATIDKILPTISHSTAGAGAALAGLPIVGGSTPAGKLKGQLKTLASQISFGELAQMREASKTGAGLGSITERELDLLANSLGAIEQDLHPDVLRSELENIKDILSRWSSGQASASPAPAQGAGVSIGAAQSGMGATPPTNRVRRFNPTTGRVE